MIAATSSDGSSWVSLTISSAERPARSEAPASGPSSVSASIASRLLRSTSSEKAESRSLSGKSAKSCARSAGYCFCSRLTRFDVAPMRWRRLTESRTTSSFRWAMRTAQCSTKHRGYGDFERQEECDDARLERPAATGRSPPRPMAFTRCSGLISILGLHRRLAADARFLDLVVARNLEERARRFGLHDVRKPIARLTHAWIAVLRHDQDLQI